MTHRYAILSVRRHADDPKAEEFGPVEYIVYDRAEPREDMPIVGRFDTQAEAEAEAARLNAENA